MRLRLFGLLAVIPLVFLAVGQPPPARSPALGTAANPRAGLRPPDVLLDGSEHGDRLVPHFGDFDGNGTTDLLVGVGERVLVYRNLGTNRRPEYARPIWFDESDPSARLPDG